MDNYKISTWGTFELPKTENEFYEHESSFFSYYIKLAILFSGIGYFIVSVADYFSHGFGEVLLMTFSIRLIFLIVCVIMFLYIHRGINIKNVIKLMFVNAIINISILVVIIMLLNPDRELDAIDEITLPVILLMLLVLSQIPLLYLAIIATYGFIVYTVFLILYFNVDSTYLVNFIAILLAIVVIGLFLGRFLNSTRRKDFTHLKEVEKLHDALLVEMGEKSKTQGELERVFNELKDSLNYAQSLQITLMPSENDMKIAFPDSFVLLKPKEEVSGDFYWVCSVGNKTIIVVADCTGHGIPGAFMSIFGLTLIKMIVKQFVNEGRLLDSAHLLRELETEVVETMKSNDEARERKDGMDISLCIVDKSLKTVQFSGAYSDLWIVRNKCELTKIKGVKKPIGIHFNSYEFVNHDIEFKTGDAIYLSTDGYRDQFGGIFGKRFMSKNLERFILSIQDKNMSAQKEALLNEFNSWKKGIGQVDDMLMIGVRF